MSRERKREDRGGGRAERVQNKGKAPLQQSAGDGSAALSAHRQEGGSPSRAARDGPGGTELGKEHSLTLKGMKLPRQVHLKGPET